MGGLVVIVGSHQSVGQHGGVAAAITARAAKYVRMSTEHQKYSTENQAEAIEQYAARRDLVIVRTYADEGKFTNGSR
jgi:predicted site-specific integrase-resolvase